MDVMDECLMHCCRTSCPMKPVAPVRIILIFSTQMPHLMSSRWGLTDYLGQLGCKRSEDPESILQPLELVQLQCESDRECSSPQFSIYLPT